MEGTREGGKLFRRSSLCILYLKDFLSINVAYNDNRGWFEIANNSMVEWHDYYGLINDLSRIPYDFEILEVFFENRIINWINCNGTSGWYDDKTGRWTGAVGKVKTRLKVLKVAKEVS